MPDDGRTAAATQRSSTVETAVTVERSTALNFLFVFAAVYLVYRSSLYPSIAGGDSGELMAEACMNGVPRKIPV